MITKFLEKILSICCEEFECSVSDVVSKSRKEQFVFCRKAFAMIVKTELDIKNDVPAKMIKRRHQSVANYVKTLPANKYFKHAFLKATERVRNESGIS